MALGAARSFTSPLAVFPVEHPATCSFIRRQSALYLIAVLLVCKGYTQCLYTQLRDTKRELNCSRWLGWSAG